MGDIVESAEFAPNYIRAQKEPLDAQIEMFLEDFIPIKDRILAMLYGNHEERFCKITQNTLDLLEFMVLKLGRKVRNPYQEREKPDSYNNGILTGIPQRGMLLVIQCGKCSYPIYIHHSSTRASVQMETQLKRTSLNWLVPLICHGHVHKMAWLPRTFFSVSKLNDGNFVRSIFRQYLLSTGCFLRYAGYAEAKSYPITDMGAPIVRFYAYKNEIEYVDPRVEYKEFLNAGVPFEPAKIENINYIGLKINPSPLKYLFNKIKSN
jgi:hypothetical protein